MLTSTTNDVSGYRATSVLGEVPVLTVGSGNVGSRSGAAFGSLTAVFIEPIG